MKYFLILIFWLIFNLQHNYAQSWTGPIEIETGAEEKVFEYVCDHCTPLDLPDVITHAVRTPNGIMLACGNAPENYFMFGKDFNSLKRSCVPVLISGDKWDVEAFDHQEWITSLFSEDGVTIHALVHNEYHDPYSRRCKPGITDPSNPCWYNFITYAVSHDAGKTFIQPASPNHLVALLPFKWNPNAAKRGAPPPHGYFQPSNIVRHAGYYYCTMMGIISNTNQNLSGTCLMRTDNLASADSWRIWDGNGFNIPLINPYSNPPADSSQYLPAFISFRTIRDLQGSLTWNTYLNQFILIGAGVYSVNQAETCGFFLSRSSDLITWSPPQLIRETILGWSPCNTQTPEQAARNIIQEAYPSLIDHDAPDINFTYADSTAYLYFMQNMDRHEPGGWGLRRDLVRIPIRLKKAIVAAIGAATTLPALSISLHQNYPNPFNPVTNIRWQSAVSGHTVIAIYNVLGHHVETLIHEFKLPGAYQVNFDSQDLPAGIYYCQIAIGHHKSGIKMIITK